MKRRAFISACLAALIPIRPREEWWFQPYRWNGTKYVKDGEPFLVQEKTMRQRLTATVLNAEDRIYVGRKKRRRLRF